MSNTIQHKRSTTSGTTPSASDLAVGEIGINTADRTLFTKHSDGTVVPVADVASDTSPQLGGELESNGHDIHIANGDYLKIGNGSQYTNSDFVLYHNDTYDRNIIGGGTGTIYLGQDDGAGSAKLVMYGGAGAGSSTIELNSHPTTAGGQFINAAQSAYPLSLQHVGSTKLNINASGTELNDDFTTNTYDINVTGGNSSINFGDGNLANFGASNDLTIQHSSSYGNIIGTSANTPMRLACAGGAYVSIDNGVFNSGYSQGASFDPDGAQILKYANATKFQTTNTGVKVTGNVTVTDKIEHDGDTDTYIEFTDNKIGFVAGGVEKLAVNNVGSPYNVSIDANAFINADLGIDANAQDATKSFQIYGSSFFGSNIIDSEGYDLLLNCPSDKRFRVNKGGYYTSGVPLIASSSGTTTDIKLYYGGSQKLATVTGGVNVTGDLTATGNVTAYSDARLKENVETIDNALNKVCNLRGVSYSKDGKKGIGVIAQEVEEVIPEVVGTLDDKDATRTVAYGNIVGVLIEAIKEQQQQIEDLTAKVTELGGYE